MSENKNSGPAVHSIQINFTQSEYDNLVALNKEMGAGLTLEQTIQTILAAYGLASALQGCGDANAEEPIVRDGQFTLQQGIAMQKLALIEQALGKDVLASAEAKTGLDPASHYGNKSSKLSTEHVFEWGIICWDDDESGQIAFASVSLGEKVVVDIEFRADEAGWQIGNDEIDTTVSTALGIDLDQCALTETEALEIIRKVSEYLTALKE